MASRRLTTEQVDESRLEVALGSATALLEAALEEESDGEALSAQLRADPGLIEKWAKSKARSPDAQLKRALATAMVGLYDLSFCIDPVVKIAKPVAHPTVLVAPPKAQKQEQKSKSKRRVVSTQLAVVQKAARPRSKIWTWKPSAFKLRRWLGSFSDFLLSSVVVSSVIFGTS